MSRRTRCGQSTALSASSSRHELGRLRADLTCPTPDLAGDFCSPKIPPPYLITRGQVLGVLPFGNIVVTLNVTGRAEDTRERRLDDARRTDDPAGLRTLLHLRYRRRLEPRTSVVMADARNCTATPVDLTAATTYKIAENDFMASGGDGYPFFTPRVTTQDIMDQVLADYIAASSPISPFVKGPLDGRINCADSNGAAAPNCPPLVPSP
jgi:2',3'-cyclic-nucleotide 2'-phosphodiesterase (5'-nucleotidase family)